MSKTFEFQIDVLKTQFHFENAKKFWAKCNFGWSSPENFGIPIMISCLHNISWKFLKFRPLVCKVASAHVLSGKLWYATHAAYPQQID